jgi:hypothetical protein
MCLQARIPPALGTIHNFIRIHDSNEIDEIALEEFDGEGTRELAVGAASCKGTSVRFLTSPILSHSPPVHMYSPSSSLYYSQGL